MKRSTLVALLTIGMLALITLVALIAGRSNPVDDIAAEIEQHDGETPAVTETIATKVPEDAVFLASSTDEANMQEWWKFFSNLEYYDPALPAELDENLVPQEIIYAAFPYEDEEGSFDISSAMYIRIDEKSIDFYDWLISERVAALEKRNDPALEGLEEDEFPHLYTLPVITHDDFLIIPSDAFAHNRLLEYIYDDEGEEIVAEGITENSDWSAISSINDSVLWFDADGYVNFFLDQAPANTREATLELLTLTAGYQDDTTFLATSKDYGKSWSGVFPTGGLDTSTVDLDEAERMILDSIVVEGNDTLVDMGLEPFSSAISASNRTGDGGNLQSFGEVRPAQVQQTEIALVPDSDFRTSVVFSPQLWSALFRGLTEYGSIAYLTLDITENNSGRLTFTFYNELESREQIEGSEEVEVEEPIENSEEDSEEAETEALD